MADTHTHTHTPNGNLDGYFLLPLVVSENIFPFFFYFVIIYYGMGFVVIVWFFVWFYF